MIRFISAVWLISLSTHSCFLGKKNKIRYLHIQCSHQVVNDHTFYLIQLRSVFWLLLYYSSEGGGWDCLCMEVEWCPCNDKVKYKSVLRCKDFKIHGLISSCGWPQADFLRSQGRSPLAVMLPQWGDCKMPRYVPAEKLLTFLYFTASRICLLVPSPQVGSAW